MKVSPVFSTIAGSLAAAFVFSTAHAASVTVQFPFAGSGWLDTTSGNSGFLTSGGYTGKLVGQMSFVDGLVTDAALKNFRITSFSPSINLYETQGDVIDIFVNGEEVQTPNTISLCCGGVVYNPGVFTLPIAVNGGPSGQLAMDYLLDFDVPQSNPSAGNWLQFGEGSVTFYGTYGVPEPSTWIMMLGGMGLAGAALRTRRRKTAAA